MLLRPPSFPDAPHTLATDSLIGINSSDCSTGPLPLIMVSASRLPPVSPTPVPTCSLAIEVPDDSIWVDPQRFARCPFAHAGVPHYAVYACHARRVAWVLRRRSHRWRWEPSFPRLCARGRAALLARASCTSCLAAPPLATAAHAHACGLQYRLGPSGGEARCLHPLAVRSLRVNRSPGVAAEGRGDGLRRCGGHGHV